MSAEARVLDAKEMMARYKVSLSTLNRRIKSGHIPQPCKSVFVGQRRWFIADVEEWERQVRDDR